MIFKNLLKNSIVETEFRVVRVLLKIRVGVIACPRRRSGNLLHVVGRRVPTPLAMATLTAMLGMGKTQVGGLTRWG